MTAQTYSIQDCEVSDCTWDECPICYDFMVGPENLVVTECGHQFHCGCLMQSVATNGFGCPMCREKMMAVAQSDQDGTRMTIDELVSEESDAEDESDSHIEEDDFIYVNDPREIPEVRENFMLRGFSWLFEQQDQSRWTSREEEFMLRGVRWLFKQQRVQKESEFDGASWNITANSLRSWRSRNVQHAEEDDDEDDDDDSVAPVGESDANDPEEIVHEKDWHSFATREQALETRTKGLIRDTKRVVPYDQLMRAYLFVTQPEIYHSSCNEHTNEKIRDKMSSQISRLDEEFNWTRMEDILLGLA